MSARSSSAGFTLLETLVMLGLVALAVSLMFQMLGNWRIVESRVSAQAERGSRDWLLAQWLDDSLRDLFASDAHPFRGDDLSLSGQTLSPLYASPGAPTAIAWRLDFSATDGWQLGYNESGESRWQVALAGFAEPRFVYLDREGREHERWPPALGQHSDLPRAIALHDAGDERNSRLLLSAVHGPYDEVITPYEPEE